MGRDPKEIIDWNIEHDYQYLLIVGTLSEIRKYVYDHAKPPVPPAYHFEKDRRGWSCVNAVDTGWPIRGELNVLLEKDDPQLQGPVGFWQASDAGILVIQAASHTTRTDARVFWKDLDDQEFAESKSAAFRLTSDDEYHTYRVKLVDHPAWKGSIVSLRLDPVDFRPAYVGTWKTMFTFDYVDRWCDEEQQANKFVKSMWQRYRQQANEIGAKMQTKP